MLKQLFFFFSFRLKLVPTFEEFILWLLTLPPDMDDVHWSQYHSHCSVCQVRYDYVMRLEKSTSKQLDYIFSAMNLDRERIHLPRLQENRGGLTNFPRSCSYFKKLSRETIMKLYQRYQIDFEMFDYSIDNYLKCSLTEGN